MLSIQSLYIVRKMPFFKHKLSSRSNSESSSDSRFSNGWEYFDDGGEETIKLTDFEKEAKKVFTFDKHPKYKEYNDLRIFQCQSSYRFSKFVNILKAPFIPLYNSVMCILGRRDYDFRPEKFLQRRLCKNSCNWDPTKCFLDFSHSGNISDLMKISFHDEFNPEFRNLFLQDKSHLQLKEDQDHHPRLLELISELGKPPIFLVNI